MFEQTFKNIDDILWKDAGCGSELDYIEQTSWILFLKYLDDLEKDRQVTAELEGNEYSYIISEAYRWETWAAPKGADGKLDHHNSLGGDDLKDFVNDELFPYLRKFNANATGSQTIEHKIGAIFSELKNKLQSGYNLREVLNLVDQLRFRSRVEKHEMSHLYESKIKNMGNAGRNGGEYYTPRPLIRTIIKVVAPQIGDTIYDGAVGSAGFLAEAYEYLKNGGTFETRRDAMGNRDAINSVDGANVDSDAIRRDAIYRVSSDTNGDTNGDANGDANGDTNGDANGDANGDTNGDAMNRDTINGRDAINRVSTVGASKLTTAQFETLQRRTFYGKEKKSLAHVIGTMNMILHGVEVPNIVHTNTLAENIADIQEKDRYKIVLANPPFGGKERAEVQQNFPIKTGETAFLFLQHFIKILKAEGKAGIVIKNTFLSNTDNASVSLRKHLLESCNLHTVLDLPGGTFTGAGVKTVVLFFDKGEATKKVWYYQLNLARNLGKTNPLTENDLAEFVALQKTKADSENSWTVKIDESTETCDLSVKNPNKKGEAALRDPQEILDEIRVLDVESAEILKAIRVLV